MSAAKKLQLGLWAVATGVLLSMPVSAQDLAFRGELSLTARHFLHDGLWPGQPGDGTSIIPEARFDVSGSLGFGDVKLELYARGDGRTGTEVFDIQKAYFVTGIDAVTLLVGSDIVFWGTAESFNPTNILNQDDLVSRPEETRKLGQPMINLSFEAGALGNMSFYGLFGFREPDLGSASTRPRQPFLPDDSHAIFERSSDSVDFAFRNTNTIGFANGSLDYAVSYFAGTERAPVILPGCANLAPPVTPVICNAVIIGAMIAWYEGGFSAQFPALFAYNALTVGIGEAIACCVLGLLLLEVMPRIPALRGRLAVR